MNIDDISIGQKLFATDHYGNYHRESVTVLGFEKNRFNADLVRVQTHYDDGDVGETVFYPRELSED